MRRVSMRRLRTVNRRARQAELRGASNSAQTDAAPTAVKKGSPVSSDKQD